MKVEIVMPQMGESITEGTLIKWHKKKGDLVKKDEIIYEISTDKVDTEIPSPEDGILKDIKVFEQETVVVGTVVAIIETNGSSDIVVEEPIVEKEIPSTHQVGGDILEVPMPKMGESIMEGTIIKWHKAVGDKIKRDEIIFEMSTDKVDTEVPSPADGILEEILFKENETVQVGLTVAKIRTTSGVVKNTVTETEKKSIEINDDSINKLKQKPAVSKERVLNKNRFYSPLVLNIARTENISMGELEYIEGSGNNGRVTKNDILEYVNSRKTGNVNANFIEPTVLQSAYSQIEKTNTSFSKERKQIVPMDAVRQKIMNHMIQSRDTSVHVTGIMEVDMTKIHNFIEANRDSLLKNEGIKLTYMAFVSFAVIKALKEFPLLNASIEGNNIVMKNYINLGIAVAVEPNGLIVPNIKNADEKNIRGLSKSIADLGLRSRSKKLVPDDVIDGTFSITNYGVFGSLFGTPIINQPEVGILGVGAVTKKPVVVEMNGSDAIVIKPMMYLSLSHDHRLVDGMLGGKFLQSIKQTLENFDTTII